MNNSLAKVKAIFLDAVEKYAPNEWDIYLDGACGDDQHLRDQVDLLLQAHKSGESLLDKGAIAVDATQEHVISERPGTEIGPYKLLQVIGEGGMGVVYMAEQSEPVARRVAVKIIKPGMDTGQVIARFEAERHALEMMDHPNIAKILDAGATESGRPYFVMELVKGIAISEYCDEQHFTPKERLELFVKVCHAVQHAHQKGIIHRDLKPSNVLVAEYDHQAVPKIIDFGVAKATGQKLTEKTMFTQYGQIVGTLEYMSPEQAKLNQLDIDTRSDVYSLGVLLYQLLTGTTPIERERLQSAAFEEMLRIIREEEPPKPSTRLSTVGKSAAALSGYRRTTPQKLHQFVRGELDWIVMRSLEKERSRRYESASNFAADVERFLNDEAVEACPPSKAYRIRKFVHRYKTATATAAVVAIAILLGLLGTSYQAIRATQAEIIAETRREEAIAAEQLTKEERDRALAAEKAEAGQRKVADERRVEAEDQRTEAQKQRREAARQATLAKQRQYISEIQVIQKELDVGNYGIANKILRKWIPVGEEHDHREWEWYYLLGEAQGDVLSSLHGHDRPVQEVVWSPDGQRLVSVAFEDRNDYRQESELRLWSATTGEQIALLSTDFLHSTYTLSWSRQANVLAIGFTDGSIRILSGETLELLKEFSTDRSAISCIEFSSDGQRLFVANYLQAEVSVWSWKEGRLEDSIRLPQLVKNIYVSPKTDRLAVAMEDGVELRQVEAKESQFKIGTEPIHVIKEPGARFGGLAGWSPDGKQIFAVSGRGGQSSLVIYDAVSGRALKRLGQVSQRISSVSWSPDGRQIATGDAVDHVVRVWETQTLTEIRTLHGHMGRVSDVAWSPDGNFLVSGSGDYSVRIWNAEPKSRDNILAGHEGVVTDVAWSPQGDLAATAGADATVRVWDMETRQCQHVFTHHTKPVRQVAFSPRGRYLASASEDATVRIMDLQSFHPVMQMDHAGAVHSVQWSANGERLASSGDFDEVHIWDAATGDLLADLSVRISEWASIDWSSKGKLVAACGERGVNVWEVDTKQQVFSRSFFGAWPSSEPIAFSADGESLAWSRANAIEVVEIYSPTISRKLTGHAGTITDIAWKPNTRSRLATTSADGTVRIWDARHGQELLRLSMPGLPPTSVAWSPDGEALLVGYEDHVIRQWSATDGYQLVASPGFAVSQQVGLRRRVMDLYFDGNLEGTEELLGLIRPTYPELYTGMRLQIHARRGEVAQAESFSADYSFLHAILMLYRGDVEAYMSVCRDRLALIDNEVTAPINFRSEVFSTIALCALHPETHIQIPKTADLYQRVLDTPQSTHTASEVARRWVMARLGRFELGEVRHVWRFSQKTSGNSLKLLEAMASAHSGNREGAELALKQVELGLMAQTTLDSPLWWEIAKFKILHREVSELVSQME